MTEITTAHIDAENLAGELGIVLSKRPMLKGHAATPETVDKALRDYLGAKYTSHPEYIAPAELLQLLGEIIKTNQELARESIMGGCFDTVQEFVADQFEKLHIEMSDSGPWTCQRGGWRADISKGEFRTICRLALAEYNSKIPKDAPVPRLTMELLPDAIDDLTRIAQLRFIEDLQKRIAYRPSDVSADAFCSGLLSCYFVQPTAENIAALKHMIWSIKRKLFNLPIPESLFFCLHSSRQHMGKTTFLRKLCTGFERIHSPNGDLSCIFKATDYKAMCRGKYLLDFQELSLDTRGGKTIDASLITTLKRIISTDTISGREMYMATEGVERQTTVFCSSTNKHVWDVINDVSGMRRYWEFNLAPPQNFNPEFYLHANVYFDNILDLYQAIDEKDNCGFFHPSRPEWEAMQAIQKGYVRENPFLMFLHSRGWEITHDGDPEGTTIPVRKLVDVFNAHLKKRGDPTWNTKHVEWVIGANMDIYPTPETPTNNNETYTVKGWTK